MSRAAATIVAKSQLPMARVLAASFHRHHPDIPFFVLLIDDVDGYFDPAQEHFHLLRLQDMQIPSYFRVRFHYRQQELLYASTPSLLAYLVERFDHVAFFKQESLVVGDLGPILRHLDDSAIVLTPHLLAPLSGPDRVKRELNILLSGSYNVGFLGVSATPMAQKFLAWWQDRLHDHCRHAVADGMHFEQRWLDLVPSLFEGVHILRDPGFNLGHWNLAEREVRFVDGVAMTGDHPCRFIRFSGFDPDQQTAISIHSSRAIDSIGPAAELFRSYVEQLKKAGYHEAKAWPYSLGCFDNGVPVPSLARELYRDLGDDVERFGDPLETGSPGSYFRWLNEPSADSFRGGRAVTRLWWVIYNSRLDLQLAFPDIAGADRDGFLAWAAHAGARDHGISERFVQDMESGP